MALPKLHYAITRQDMDAFQQLLEGDADVNQLDSVMGNSPLHIAAQQTSPDWALALLSNGAFVNLQTPKNGVTPLMLAVWHRKPIVVKALLTNPDINIEIVSTFGLKAEQFIDFGASQDDLFGQAQAQELRELFAKHRCSINKQQSLLNAVNITTDLSMSDQEKARAIAQQSDLTALNIATSVSSSGNDEHTAVMIAARDGLTETLNVLMKVGGDQTIPDHYMKAIPLHKAAYNGHAQVIDVLSRYPGFTETLNAQGPNNGYTPLHDAVWHGHVDAAKKLIARGAKTNLKGYDGKTPLDLAKQYHYQSIINLLENTTNE